MIVHGSTATASEMKAATELQTYMQKISGVTIPVVDDSTEASKKEIIVGSTNRETKGAFNRQELQEDGFVIKTRGEKLWLIGGGDRGTLYSVYTFLEDYMGCRFYTETNEYIPNNFSFSLSYIEEDKQIPQFVFRDIGWGDYLGTGISVKRKTNSNFWGRNIPDEWGGMEVYAKSGGHTFSEFISSEEYFKGDTKEYFSMNAAGERINTGQLCLTNENVKNIIIQKVKQWLQETPGASYVSVSQNDAENPCLCDHCKAVYEEEGGAYSGTIIRLVNAVADAIKDEYPNVMVDTYAYNYSRSAPKTKARDNVVVRLCTNRCCARHGLTASCGEWGEPTHSDGTSHAFMQDLAEWIPKQHLKMQSALFIISVPSRLVVK